MNPARVLSLYWGFSLGGVAKYAALLDASKRYTTARISHLCIRGREWPTDEQTLQLLNAHTLWIRSRSDISWISALKKRIETYDPDLIMTHGFNAHFVVQLMRVLGCYKKHAICSYHGEYHPTTPARRLVAPLFNRFTEWYIRRALETVAVADYTKSHLVQRNVDPSRITVIHNGIADVQVEPDVRTRLRQEWSVAVNDTVVGVASRLDPVKGIEYLVSAIGRLAVNHKNLVLVLVGTGTREDCLRKQADALGIGTKLRFIGFRRDVAECLSAFDIFALPSLAEYHSIGLLEAMRAQKAIVATDVGGNTESVRGGSEALVVPAADTAALEGALYRLITDGALAEHLARNARARFLSEFTEDVMLKNTGEWLSHCAARAEQARA